MPASSPPSPESRRERPSAVEPAAVTIASGGRPLTSLRIGTRASALATAQSGQIARRLGEHELVTVSSEGDRDQQTALDQLGGTGVFVSNLREALLRGEVDVIVHSFKDLPTAPADGIRIAAVPRRADARDAVVTLDGTPLAGLPAGARIGTGSPRRRAQLLAARPDLEVVAIRGNIDTRLGRLADSDPERHLDAVVLAAAGLVRLGREERTELLELSDWPTAPAQGALAVEIREDAPADVAKRVTAIDHRATRLAAFAERGVLARLEAGCAAPVAASAALEDGLLFLTATVYALDGSDRITASHAAYPEDSQDPAAELATRVAEELLAHGAADLAPLGA